MKSEIRNPKSAMERTILITGGAGFIGSHVVRLFVNKYPQNKIVNLDKLTYAGNLANLRDVESKPNYEFVKGDITDAAFIQDLFQQHQFDGVIHLAAESHVDRSIASPMDFIMTNVVGTANLLNASRHLWLTPNSELLTTRFYHVSTDEVYGSLELNSNAKFTESTPYDPHSPYSASKAGSDHLVRAYYDTYKHTTIHTSCPSSYPTAPTTTAPIIFLKN
jgi:dTDP-glucose 4,6-dehydratase